MTPALDVPTTLRQYTANIDDEAFAWSFPATTQKPQLPAPAGEQWMGNDRGAIMCWARSVTQSQEACWDPVNPDAEFSVPPASVPVTAIDRSTLQVLRVQNQMRPLAMTARPAPPALSMFSNHHRPYFGSQRHDENRAYNSFPSKSSQDDSSTSFITSILTGDDADDENIDARTALTSVSESQHEEGSSRALSFLSSHMKHWMVPTSLPKSKYAEHRPESPVTHNLSSHTPRRPLLHEESLQPDGRKRFSHQRHHSTPLNTLPPSQRPEPFAPNTRAVNGVEPSHNDAVLSSSHSSSIASYEFREIPITRGRERRHSDYPLRRQPPRYEYDSRSPVVDITLTIGGNGRSPCSPPLYVGFGSSTVRRSRHFRGRSCGRTGPISAISTTAILPPADLLPIRL